jgi:hypothetical protein
MGGPGQIHCPVPLRSPTSSNIADSQVVSDFGSERSTEPFGLPSAMSSGSKTHDEACLPSMGTQLLQQISLMDNGVPLKLRKLQNNTRITRITRN